VEALALLATQLGYPSQADQIAHRLRTLPAGQACIFVAESEGAVIGWIHVSVYGTILLDNVAEIIGLVVDEKWRGQGIGRALLQAAEKWAITRDCATLIVRSNIVRQRAHGFYLRNGFQRVKTSFTFSKALA
jgi:ribosomal protein S18 acetylase RimI-like enzyme